MTSYGEGTPNSRRGFWIATAGALLAAGACAMGIIGQRRPPPAPPAVDAPSVTIEVGPSAWQWRSRRASTQEPAIALAGAEATSLDPSRPACAAGDRFYTQSSDGQCYLSEQPLLALVTQTQFASAPRRHDGSDFAALLAPSRAAGEPDADAEAQRSGAARARANTYVDDREATWCGFAIEGAAPRLQLRGTCALDRLDLYAGAAPRVDRTQSCGVDRVEACTETCESNDDCNDDDSLGCGCAQSRCVRGRCTACAPRRVCAEPTFTTRASPWVFRVAVSSEHEAMARALVARPSAFRTLFHFAVTAASRDVRPRRDGSIEFDSGYRLQVRPLALSAALCAGECRRSMRASLALFTVPQWQGRGAGLRLSCTRGRCETARESAGAELGAVRGW